MHDHVRELIHHSYFFSVQIEEMLNITYKNLHKFYLNLFRGGGGGGGGGAFNVQFPSRKQLDHMIDFFAEGGVPSHMGNWSWMVTTRTFFDLVTNIWWHAKI
ncbi:hypothetical protein ACJX0J_030620, partial [Zea mays]